MRLYMGLGMDLLASTFDVESVVFLKRGSHFLAFYGPLYGLGEGLVEATGLAFNVWFSLGKEQKNEIQRHGFEGKTC